MSGDRDDRLEDALLGEEQRDQIEAYAARGRPFQPLTIDALSHAWAAACIDVAFGDDGQLVELAFLANELVVRGLHPPEQLIPTQARQALHGRIAQSTRFQAVTVQIGRVRQRLADQWRLGARLLAREDASPSAPIALIAPIAEPTELPASERADDREVANCANCANRSEPRRPNRSNRPNAQTP